MPADILTTDTLFPEMPEDLRKKDSREAEVIQTILDYLFMLKEQLRFSLSNIGMSNFNDTELGNLSNYITTPITININNLEAGQAGLASRLADTEGNVATLTQTTTTLTSQMSTAQGDISTLQQTATSLTSRIYSAEGNISTLQQTATSLTSRITSAEGNISTLQQTSTSLTSRITTAEGNISTLQQTSSSLTSRITTAEGNISSLTQTVNGFSADISDSIKKSVSAQLTTAGFSLSIIDDNDNVVTLINKNGIQIKNGGFTIFNSSNVAVFSVTPAGAISMKGALTSGSTITGTAISAGTISGASISAGSISGTSIVGGTITGATLATNASVSGQTTYAIRIFGTTLETGYWNTSGTWQKNGAVLTSAANYGANLAFYWQNNKWAEVGLASTGLALATTNTNGGNITLTTTTGGKIHMNSDVVMGSNKYVRTANGTDHMYVFSGQGSYQAGSNISVYLNTSYTPPHLYIALINAAGTVVGVFDAGATVQIV